MTSRTRRLREALGQLRQPPEFRVGRPFLSPAQADWLAAAIAETEPRNENENRSESEGVAEVGTGDGAGSAGMAEAATGIWRALRKLDRGVDTLSAADLRQVRRQVLASRRALAADGLEIHEHDGAPFDSGLSLEVLLFQEDPALTREVVLETVRPTVYFRGARIQMGQVIVGQPTGVAREGKGDQGSA